MLTQIPDELKDIIDDNGKDFFELYNGDDDLRLYDEIRDEYQSVDLLGWSFKVVQHFGGEGKGDRYYNVVKFTKEDEFFFVQFEGWYDSNNGSEFTNIRVVQPKEKTITVYEKV